jgi:hypothetical protein
VQRQRAYVGGRLQPGAALIVVCLAVMTLPPRSTAPTVAGCRLVGCSVVSGRPLRSHAVAGVSLHVCVCLGLVLASHATSLPAAAAAAWRGRGRVHIAGWRYVGVGPVRGLRVPNLLSVSIVKSFMCLFSLPCTLTSCSSPRMHALCAAVTTSFCLTRHPAL